MKVQLLLALRRGLAPASVRSSIVDAIADPGWGLAVPAATGRLQDGPAEFGAVVERHVDEAQLDELVHDGGALAARLAEIVDPATSAAVVGEEHVVVPGDARYEVVFPLHRQPSLSPAQFARYWRHRHTTVGVG